MWKDAYLESRVLSADPLELVRILYELTLNTVRDARHRLAAGDIVGRSRAISKAIDALMELEGSLDLQAGGAISRNLAQLYLYMRTQLLDANLRQQDGPLAEVESLLKTLSEAWAAIRPAAPAMPIVEMAPAAPVWGTPLEVQLDAECAGGWSA